MLPGDRRIAQLYKTFTHWLANTGRPCLPAAPQMRAEYVKEGKNHFTVAIGCTGGQHRSVVITNYLFDHYRQTYHCYKEHRDVTPLEKDNEA